MHFFFFVLSLARANLSNRWRVKQALFSEALFCWWRNLYLKTLPEWHKTRGRMFDLEIGETVSKEYFTWHHMEQKISTASRNWNISFDGTGSRLVALFWFLKPLRLLNELPCEFNHDNYDEKKRISFGAVWKIRNEWRAGKKKDSSSCQAFSRVARLRADARTIKMKRDERKLEIISTKNWSNDFLMILSTAQHQPASLLLCPAQIFNYSVTTWCIKIQFFSACSWAFRGSLHYSMFPKKKCNETRNKINSSAWSLAAERGKKSWNLL